MKRRICSFVLAVLLITGLTITSFAETKSANITPSLHFTGTTAYCKVEIESPGQYINATLELWWGTTLIDSWSGYGNGSVQIDGSHSVVHGRTYTLKVTGTVGGDAINVLPVEAYFA